MRTSEKTAAQLLVASLLCLLLVSPLAAQELRLHVLAATGTAEEIQAALLKGADFNDRDYAGVTALMAAAGYNHNENVVPVLLRYGAVVDARDGNGETALMFAAERNGDPAVIDALLTGGAGLEIRDKLGLTPLMYAAKCNPSLDVVIALLKAGANVNARDSYGMSPLLYAAWVGQNPAIASALLSAGADAKVRSIAGRTLLEYAEDNAVLVKDTEVLHQLQDAMKGTRESAERSRIFQTRKTGAPVPITLWPGGRLWHG
jgi:ankyrin repeat protein